MFSFLTKPVDRDALYKAIDEALALSATPAGDEAWREDIVTRSPLMLRLLEQVKMVAQSDVSVLINGQSGTGKEVVAQAIHAASPRAGKAFIAINCGALPEQLLESELFGHAKGAFTGAVSSREGLFQAAAGGTLFLDEIGDMPLSLQVKLLRVLQERRCGRWAATAIWTLTCASSPPPTAICKGDGEERVPRGSLLPPQRGEPEDPGAQRTRRRYPAIGQSPVARSAQRHKPFVRSFSTDAMKRLMTASWPGNVRQLVNVIEQCVALTSAPVISEALVEQALEGKTPRCRPSPKRATSSSCTTCASCCRSPRAT